MNIRLAKRYLSSAYPERWSEINVMTTIEVVKLSCKPVVYRDEQQRNAVANAKIVLKHRRPWN